MDYWVTLILFGLALGFLLFLISSGLTLSFGLMKILNATHGAYYLMGAYVGLSAYRWSGDFLLGILAGAATAGLIGIIMYLGFLRYLPQLLDQVILCFGFIYIITDTAKWIWGPISKMIDAPSLLAGNMQIGEFSFPYYRLMIIGVGLIIGIALWLFQEKTRFGAIIRAGLDDREMTMALGINLKSIAVWTFALGSVLAGAAGVFGLPMLGAYLESSMEIFLLAIIVIILGGIGSLQGALAGSLLIGVINSVCKTYSSLLAFFMMYLIIIIVLLIKPRGLFGKSI